MEAIIFTKELDNKEVNDLGVKVTLECEISKSGLRLDWYKDGNKLRRDQRLEVVADGKEHR